MIAQVQQADGTFVEEEFEPECGQDYCDRCGECLACCNALICYDNAGSPWRGGHIFYLYREN